MEPREDIYDPDYVADLFDRCALHYRWWAAAASFGLVWLWRRQCVNRLPGQVALARHQGADINTRTPQILDLMAGTGEVWPHLLSLYPEARITAVDISRQMHNRALSRLHGPYAHRIRHWQADVLRHDLSEGGADLLVSSFGLKTLTPEAQRDLAKRIARALKPGGVFSLIEASDPKGWRLRPLYRIYTHHVLPRIERFFLGGATDFRMFGTYTERFGDCTHFAESLRAEGLFVSPRRHVFGCATSVAGFKPLAGTHAAP